MTECHLTSDQRYGCIVADPPWQTAAGRAIGDYVRAADGSQPFGVRGQRARKLAYPTMTLVEIMACVPPASDQANLYLWTTSGWLREAFDVVDAWGFQFSTVLVWAKNPIGGGLGGAYGIATEFCLFARRGSCVEEGRVGRNWWNWRRPYDERGKPKHSAKPNEFYEMVEAVSPGPRLEMFARAPREGWDVWGNEVESDVKIA
jgi:N6-adenosine-specific RNA methylase IME4